MDTLVVWRRPEEPRREAALKEKARGGSSIEVGVAAVVEAVESWRWVAEELRGSLWNLQKQSHTRPDSSCCVGRVTSLRTAGRSSLELGCRVLPEDDVAAWMFRRG